MGLSEIRGERVFEVIAELAEPVANITADDKVMALFEKGKGDSAKIQEKAKEAVPALMKDHKDDMVAILSAIKGTTPKEYLESVTLPSLLADVYGVITDNELLAFLSSDEKQGS